MSVSTFSSFVSGPQPTITPHLQPPPQTVSAMIDQQQGTLHRPRFQHRRLPSTLGSVRIFVGEAVGTTNRRSRAARRVWRVEIAVIVTATEIGRTVPPMARRQRTWKVSAVTGVWGRLRQAAGARVGVLHLHQRVRRRRGRPTNQLGKKTCVWFFFNENCVLFCQILFKFKLL